MIYSKTLKRTVNILLFGTFIFAGCATAKKIHGIYNFGNAFELILKENPNEFQYFFSGEMGLHQYSTGKWKLKGNKLYLHGFDDSTLKMLNVESFIDSSVNPQHIKLTIHCVTDNTINYIMSRILVNDKKIDVQSDTVINFASPIRTLAVKSFIVVNDILLSTGFLIDTLNSKKIVFSEAEKDGFNVTLNYSVRLQDFMRVIYRDTLRVTNRHIRLSRYNVALTKKNIN